MTTKRKIVIAALCLLGLVLAGLAALAATHVYWTHIATDCGADCGRPAVESVIEGGL